MNRIVLIGNGFDLAHGLKTSYKDFIDWYWKDWGEKLLYGLNKTETDGLCSFKLKENTSKNIIGRRKANSLRFTKYNAIENKSNKNNKLILWKYKTAKFI